MNQKSANVNIHLLHLSLLFFTALFVDTRLFRYPTFLGIVEPRPMQPKLIVFHFGETIPI